MSGSRVGRVALAAALLFVITEPSVIAQESDSDNDGSVVVDEVETLPSLPLVEVPVGCEPWLLADIVFVGTVVARDSKTVRFVDITVRSGDPNLISDGGTVDIRFGYDAQYMTEGDAYLVGAYQHPDLGILVSKLSEAPVDFAGDEIVGVSENDVVCPEAEDPIMTLTPDGTPVEYSIIDPMLSERSSIVGALLVPFTIALVVIFLLAMLRLSSQSLIASLRDLRRPRQRSSR
jgi:hypothetical protein